MNMHETATGNGDHRQRSGGFKRALLWLAAILVAVFPFPRWW